MFCINNKRQSLEASIFKASRRFFLILSPVINSAIATEGCKIVFNDDGSITETGNTYVKTTSFASSYIMETYTANDGSLSKTMKTTFNSDGSISKEVS